MASEHLIKDGEDWNYIFVARDFDGNEDQPSEEDSDSDSDYLGEDRETQSDIEDEPDIGLAIGVQNTQILRDVPYLIYLQNLERQHYDNLFAFIKH